MQMLETWISAKQAWICSLENHCTLHIPSTHRILIEYCEECKKTNRFKYKLKGIEEKKHFKKSINTQMIYRIMETLLKLMQSLD